MPKLKRPAFLEGLKAYTTIARAGVIGTLLFIIFGSQYGRALQRSYPGLVSHLSHFAVLCVVLVVGGCLFYVLKVTDRSRVRLDKRRLARTGVVTVIFLTAGYYLSERMIVAPLERIHFVKYGFLAFFLYYSHRSESVLKKILLAVFWSAYIGAGEESLQYWDKSRVYDTRDMLLNAVGAILGGMLVFIAEEWVNAVRVKESEEPPNTEP